MSDPSMQKIMTEFLSKPQIQRLNRIMNTAIRRERAEGATKSLEPIMDDKEGMITSFARKFLAASFTRNIGDKLGFKGTVQGPGAGVKLSEEMYSRGLDPARQLIVDAVTATDDKLLRALLVPEMSEKLRYTQLQAWLTVTAAKYGIDLTSKRQETH
jgi:hypothetical protein